MKTRRDFVDHVHQVHQHCRASRNAFTMAQALDQRVNVLFENASEQQFCVHRLRLLLVARMELAGLAPCASPAAQCGAVYRHRGGTRITRHQRVNALLTLHPGYDLVPDARAARQSVHCLRHCGTSTILKGASRWRSSALRKIGTSATGSQAGVVAEGAFSIRFRAAA